MPYLRESIPLLPIQVAGRPNFELPLVLDVGRNEPATHLAFIDLFD